MDLMKQESVMFIMGIMPAELRVKGKGSKSG